ncbi:MAG: nitrophenyl compound nitroreductase subunit ArsF family protein [bacterium]
MKPKSLVTIVLLAFMLGSVVFLIAGGSKEDSKAVETRKEEGLPAGQDGAVPHGDDASVTSPGAKAQEALPQSSPEVIAYYFHGRARCPSCVKIETYTKEALERDFAHQLKSGRLKWRPINVEEPDNKHYIQDYKLYTKSVIIADLKDGRQIRWKNLEKVWELLYHKDVFLNYIGDEVRAYFGENP